MIEEETNLKKIQSYIQILTNNIVYYLQEFDKELHIENKRIHLEKLKQLIIEVEKYFSKEKEVFFISSEKEKQEYKRRLKENSKKIKAFTDQITERKNLLQTISMKTSFIFPKLSIDLGEINKHTLDYSKIHTIINDAKITYKETEQFINEIENIIKNKPLIDPKDPGYQTYLSFMRKKQEINEKNKRSMIKCGFHIFCLLFVLVFLIYWFIFRKIPPDL